MDTLELKRLVKEALWEFERERNQDKLFSCTEIAKRLGIAYNTVKKLIREGKLKTTRDGKYVTERAINDYLQTV
jgi:excisionase family DNA binding protein